MGRSKSMKPEFMTASSYPQSGKNPSLINK